MPSSRRPSPPTLDSPEAEYSRRVRTHSTRPQQYSVAHLPRRVIPASDNGDELQSEREAKIKRRLHFKRRLTMWELAGFAASCIACAFLVREISGAQADFRQVLAQVQEKQTHFSVLDKQRIDEKNRLAHLKSEKGREQLLAERGYLQPGDRILLFPAKEKAGDQSQP